MIKQRYYVGPALGLNGAQEYRIYDHYYPVMQDVCRLPNAHGHLVPLRFSTRRDAESWLERMVRDTRSPAQEYRELEEQAERVRRA